MNLRLIYCTLILSCIVQKSYQYIDILKKSRVCNRCYISNRCIQNMAQAYLLINCELGSEESVISKLKSIEGVKEVNGTFGAYDILVKIESDRLEDLRETITWKVRKIDNIRSTLTLMGIESKT